MHAADMLCSISFDRDDEFFATAGVSRRIKVCQRAFIIVPASVYLAAAVTMSAWQQSHVCMLSPHAALPCNGLAFRSPLSLAIIASLANRQLVLEDSQD